MPLRVIFMGTPEFSVPTLRAIAEAGHEISAVYTQPPRAAGRRGLELTPSPVQREAERLGIDVRTPTSLKGEAEQAAEGVTYARKIDKSETHVDWTRPAAEVHNHLRGLSPFPGAWSEIDIGGRVERLKLLRSTLSDGLSPSDDLGESGGILDDRL